MVLEARPPMTMMLLQDSRGVVGAGAGRWFSAECSGVSNTVDMDWRGDFPKREMFHQRPYLALGRTEWCRMASVG